MKTPIGDTVLELVKGDITQQDVDAIVNAANSNLAPGAGVCGAIRDAGGPEIFAECRQYYKRCPTGEARLTPGFRLPARWVIHTVGPVWRGGAHDEAELLAACYRNALRLAREHGVASIAFPAISCGVYGYPVEQAAAIAVRETHAWLAAGATPARIVLCCFGPAVAEAYRAAAEKSSYRQAPEA